MGSMDRSLVSLLAFALPATVMLGACVSKNTYDGPVFAAPSPPTPLSASADREKADEATIAKLQQDLTDAQAQVQDRDQKLSDLSTSDHNLQAQLDEATAINAKLRAALERLGKNVDSMLQEKGTLTKALDDTKARLEELRKAQAAAEARAQLFQQFVQKFKAMIDAGQLKIATRNGRLVLQLPNDVLFDTGQTSLDRKSVREGRRVGL